MMLIGSGLDSASEGWIYANASPGVEQPWRALLAYVLQRKRCSLWIEGQGLSFEQALSLDGGWLINECLPKSEKAMETFCAMRFSWWGFALAWLDPRWMDR